MEIGGNCLSCYGQVHPVDVRDSTDQKDPKDQDPADLCVALGTIHRIV
jgi:hypothetical protein